MSHRHGKIGLSLRLAALLLAGALGAAEVGEVKFEQSGADKLTEAQLALNIRLRKGAEYRREILDEDIKRLSRTGNYSDVEALVNDLPGGKVQIVFKVRLKPRISSLKLVGNAKFSTHDLAGELTLAKGALLNDLELRKTLNNLRKFYHDKGYKDVNISFAQVPDGPGKVALTIKVAENLRLKVNDVKFEGATRFSQWDLRHSIANQFSYWNYLPFVNDFLNHGLLDRKEYLPVVTKAWNAMVNEAVHANGFLGYVQGTGKEPKDGQPVAYDSKPDFEDYGTGCFLLAGSEVYKL